MNVNLSGSTHFGTALERLLICSWFVELDSHNNCTTEFNALSIYLLTQTTLNLDFYKRATSQLFRRPLSKTLQATAKPPYNVTTVMILLRTYLQALCKSRLALTLYHSLQIIACNSLHILTQIMHYKIYYKSLKTFTTSMILEVMHYK